MTPLVLRALEYAIGDIGRGEEGGNNRGPFVEECLASVDLPPGYAWCCAWLHFCFMRAAVDLAVENPFPKTGSVLRAWRMAGERYHSKVPRQGSLGVHDAGSGLGHIFFVKEPLIPVNRLVTVEGNTNAAGGREGDKVATRSRPMSYVNVGYLDFSSVDEPEPVG